MRKPIGKLSSDSQWKQLGIWGIVLLVLFAVITTGSALSGEGFWKIVVSVLSPVPIREGRYRLLKLLAYITGLIVFSGGLIATITNMIRTAGDRYLNGTAHYRFRKHILFLGYDELMTGTLKSLMGKKKDIVVAVPCDVATVRNSIYQHLAKDEQKQISVIQASRINVDDLKKRAYVAKATQIYIIGQPQEPTHDTENLKCLGLIASICAGRDKTVWPSVMYYLRNQSTFYLLHRQKLQSRQFRQEIENAGLAFDEKRIDEFVIASEPFNFYESMSRHLLFGSLTGKESLTFGETANRRPHLVVIGMSDIGTALTRTVLMAAHFPKQRLRLTFIDENAYNGMHHFIGRHRTFFDNCHYSYRNVDNEAMSFDHAAILPYIDVDVEFVQCGLSHPAIMDYIRPNENLSLNIAICTDDSPQNMAAALYLPRAVLESDTPVWVYQNGDNSMDSFMRHRIYKNVGIFSTHDYFVEDRSDSKEWQLTKAVSSGYDMRFLKKVTDWKLQNPKSRWSSLYGAVSKIISLQAIGKAGVCPIQLTDEEKGDLAVTEHNRWNTEKLLNGWIPATQEQLESLKYLPAKEVLNEDYVQPFIVSYDQLPSLKYIDEHVIEKDFAQIEDVVNELNRMHHEQA